MLRRSRISVRPNVRPAGRGPAPANSQDTPPSQETPAAGSQASEDLHQAGGQCVKDTTTTAVLEASTESTTPREDGKDPNGEASSSTPSAGLQRRKRFSVMPNLAKPRVAATPALTRSSPRTPKSPVRAGTETPAPTPEAPEAPSQTDSGPPQGMRSPRRRPSGGSRQAKGQPKPRPLSPASPGPETTTTSLGNAAAEDSSLSQQTPQAAGKGSIQSDLLKKTPTIKVPSTPLEMVPSSSLPDKEGISVSERAKTLVARSVSGGLTGLAPGKSRLSRFLNDPTDLQRLAKARKLRELLRQEMSKEKKRSKAKVCVSEYTLDPSKMTMRDLIYYLPDTNPMTSYLVEEQRENETVLPLTPPREESPERPPTPEAPTETASLRDEDEDEDDDGVMVPRVKVAEDGSLIIDEESLTVEVLRQKGPNPADDRDPIFERGSTTTYSSFRKGTHVKPWSNKETDMFFLAISMVGTDFSMIGQLFPHRGRTEIKNKFKKEERANSWRIDKAFKEKRRLDLEFFTSLLEKILAAEAKRNKNNKSPTEKIGIKKNIKQKEKKAAKQLSDVEEEGLDAEMDTEEVEEGEKENENVSNEGSTLSSAPTPKRKRESRDGGGESSPEKAKDGKKKKSNLITSDQEEAGVPEDSEAGPPESSKQAEGPVEAAKGPVVIKPAQLSRGRSQRPLPNLGRKWGQRGPEPKTKPKPNVKDGATPAEEENTEEGLSKEQVDKDASPSVSQMEKKKAGKLSSSEGEEEEANDKPIKPTRYGRIPKKTQLLNYPAKEDGDSPSDSAPTPASDGSPSTSSSAKPKSKPATRRAKIKPGPALPGRKGQSAARKSKLVTLRASQSEDEDEDEEEGAWREVAQAEQDTHNPTSPDEENQAPAFIPMSLRSPQPVAIEVEETMEELDISVNAPDVLGISHGGGEIGTVPCEHQLDLLVDVIDFLSPDNMEVSEESYNEAARTLLAIGNLTHLSQAAEAFTAGADDFITEECSNEDQLSQMTPQPTDQSQTSTIPSESLTPYLRVTEASRITEDSVPVAMPTTASVPVTTTTASIPVSKITASIPVTTTTASAPVTLTTTASILVTTSTASVPVPQSSDTPTLETPPIEEGPLRQREGTGIGHASQVESGSEVSEGSEQQTTSQTRRSHFPKVKPNLGRAARTTQPKPQQTTTTLSEPPQTTTTLSEPPQTTTTLSEPPQTTTTLSEPPLEPMLNITTLSEPQPIQRTRVAHSKPQPTLNTTTQSEPPQPILISTTNTLSKQQPTQSTTILSQPQPTPSLEQPGPVTLRPRVPVPESPLRSSAEVKVHEGREENSSFSLSAGGSQPGTSDSDRPKQTGPPTRRARLPKAKPNLGCTARAATRSAVQVPESRPSPEVQTPDVADEVPMEIQPVRQVVPLSDIIDTTQEEMQPIHQAIRLTDVIDTTQGDMSLFTEGGFFSQQSDAVFIQHSETSVSTAPLDQAQSDPDEPIFILSLTEIPVFPTGEEYGCTSQTLSEPFSFLPDADAGSQLQWSSDIVAPGGGLEKGNAGVLCEVPEPMSVDEVLPQPSYTSIKDVESGSTAGSVGVCASAKPSEDSMADAETSEDTYPPPKKRKVPDRARRDKLQVRPNTAVRKQTSCSAPAKEAVSPITPDQTTSLTTITLDTDHPTASSPPAQPGPSVTGTASREVVADEPQRGTVGCLDRTETERTPTGGEDNSSGAESQAARQITPLAMSGPLSRPGRRPRGFLSFMSNKNTSPVDAPPRGSRAAARRPQVNTTRPGGKRAAPAPSTTTRTMPSPSTTHNTTTPTRATRTTTKPDFSPRVTREKPSDVPALHSDPEPSTSLCTTATESSQVPAAQTSTSPCVDSGSADEEPINVSQYFFSDIFTEVEENEG